MTKAFFRGSVACELASSEDGWTFVVYLGVNDTHPFYGKLFHAFPHPLALKPMCHVTRDVGNEALNNKWWFSFETTRAVEYSALYELCSAADELNALSDSYINEN